MNAVPWGEEHEKLYGLRSRLGTALLEVHDERIRQDMLFGPVEDVARRHSLAYWLAILAEEFGEVSKEIVECGHDGKHRDYPRLERLKTELIQVAAVAVCIHEAVTLIEEESCDE